MVVTSAEAATRTSLLFHGNKVRGRHLQKQTKEAAGRQNKIEKQKKQNNTTNKEKNQATDFLCSPIAKNLPSGFFFFFFFQLEENERKEKKKVEYSRRFPFPPHFIFKSRSLLNMQYFKYKSLITDIYIYMGSDTDTDMVMDMNAD